MKNGFTLIELLVALVLASLLVIATSGSLGLLAKHNKALEENGATEAWISQLQDLLRHDLENAVDIELSKEQLQIKGFNASEIHGGSFLKNQTTVYKIAELDSEFWLVREKDSEPDRYDLIARGVKSIELMLPLDDEYLNSYEGPAIGGTEWRLKDGEGKTVCRFFVTTSAGG
ncbi:prepilin-type N-terminal cleavage/methylation domain-containing protein [Planctomycetota bacterium]